MSKVSVIVPVYNVEQYIKRCLKSILDQSWQDFEILCVDDCGQDQSISIIEQMQKEYPAAFGAKVYKIARDGQGNRLTYLKVTGGTLHAKQMIAGRFWHRIQTIVPPCRPCYKKGLNILNAL